MDWTSIYDESGEEDLILPHLMDTRTQPRLSRLVSRVYLVKHHHHDEYSDNDDEDHAAIVHHRLWEISEEHPYTLTALYYLSINYILGVGCLGVPYAFARAGFVLCASILATVTLLSYVTVMWVAETGARFERSKQEEDERSNTGEDSTIGIVSEKSPLVSHDSFQSHTSMDVLDRYEVVDLVDFYLGHLHKILYQVSLMSLMYVGLLAYTQVFCGAIAELIWGNNKSMSTGLPQLIFGIIVIPLSCVELDEQVAVQSLMALVRFVAIFIMVAGSVLALWMDDSAKGTGGRTHPPYFAPQEPDGCQMSYTACFSGFGVAFSTALFSQLFQHSVPGLLRPLRDQTHKIPKVPQVFGASLLTTCSFYLLLGTTAAAYFGADTRSSVNLNFANFTFGFDPITTPHIVLSTLRLASSIVVVFPALDTLSVFPLIANTLGNNLMAATSPAFVKWVARHLPSYKRMVGSIGQASSHDLQSRGGVGYSALSVDERKLLTIEAAKISTIFWRLVAAIPPLVGSLWATDLSFSLLLAGVAGLYVAFFAPSLLQLTSCRLSKELTVYSGWYSQRCFAYPVLLFATFSLGVVLLQISDAWDAMHDYS